MTDKQSRPELEYERDWCGAKIKELQAQLTKAKAVSDRWQKDCRWYQDQYADCATKLKEATGVSDE